MANREELIVKIVNAKGPIHLADLTKLVQKQFPDVVEAQVYASCNQAVTKNKIARGAEKKTYVAAGNVVYKEFISDDEPVEKQKRTRKPKVSNDRYSLPEIIEDLENAGLSLVDVSKTENSLAFPIMGDYDASYILNRFQSVFKVSPTRYAKGKQGPSVILLVYP